MLPTFEVAHIVRQYGDRFIANKQPLGYHKKVLNAIAICRTAQLGGHVDACDKCSHTRISYNSCRNRHCPKCQSTEREKMDHCTQGRFTASILLPRGIHHPRTAQPALPTAPKGNV
ncbi:MAG: transposase zinc-binding domain-containing protein [Bacteroidetes bacterium]|nr:transposase zinc-binding domain-containing protein [Bacteroidota bacterium]